jgi:cellulose synthase (UDP-forming)
MDIESLSALQLLAPTFFVVAAIYLIAPLLPLSRPSVRFAIFGVVWLMVARYAYWRLFVTVLPAEGAWQVTAWIWFCYAIEMFAFADALILYVMFLKRADRNREADRHEQRLRASPPGALPSVDVYIPTYNEPQDVLEKTIIGAVCLDYPDARVWILDDGRRSWLKDYCEAKQIGYITRADNSHAKAGNINHALTRTNAEFVAIFDADFIPQKDFLMRTMGFFEDERVGIVQVPHAFYNHDPLQTNLELEGELPDDQRFFFEAIMPSRDAWDAAFCCGSNSVTRRSALRAAGDGLPTGSITEDILLSLVLLRHGYITRYLCEPLAYGLAPESLKAMFVQRQRWARGAVQMLFLRDGPLGPGLRFMHRLFFLPTHWLSQSCMMLVAIMAPIVFLHTGIAPLVNVTAGAALFYIMPTMLAVIGGLCAYAPRLYFPLAAQVFGVFQSFRLLPTILVTLIKPFGHVFKVTPKGRSTRQPTYERGIFWLSALLIALSISGLIINSVPDLRVVEGDAVLTMAGTWTALNIMVLFLVCMMALQAVSFRTEERFELDEAVWVIRPGKGLSAARIKDISLSGVAIEQDPDHPIMAEIEIGATVRLFIVEVGFVEGRVVRRTSRLFALRFLVLPGLERDLLIRKLFTLGRRATTQNPNAMTATRAMLSSIIWARARSRSGNQPEEVIAAVPEIKLPREALLIPPRPQSINLTAQGAERRLRAAA